MSYELSVSEVGVTLWTVSFFRGHALVDKAVKGVVVIQVGVSP